nr:hypothetical protein GCM10025732_40340 [Glycomyces mayteni]
MVRADAGPVRGPRQGRPTLEEVAERAGVSRATVSRVVNGQTSVNEDLRRAVEAAADELGYVPHAAARSLVTHRTDSVALILPESPHRVFSDDQFFPGVIRGVATELDAAGKLLVLMTTGSAEARQRAERYAVGGHVDGVMFASLHDADLLPELMMRRGVPVVCNGLPQLDAPCIDVDHLGGVRAAVDYLIAQGRRRIATIAGPLTWSRAGPASTGTGRRSRTRTGGRSSPSATSPPSPGRPRCASSSRTSRTSTRCSWPRTSWRTGRSRRCARPGGGCRTMSPSSASTTSPWPRTRTRR